MVKKTYRNGGHMTCFLTVPNLRDVPSFILTKDYKTWMSIWESTNADHITADISITMEQSAPLHCRAFLFLVAISKNVLGRIVPVPVRHHVTSLDGFAVCSVSSISHRSLDCQLNYTLTFTSLVANGPALQITTESTLNRINFISTLRSCHHC